MTRRRWIADEFTADRAALVGAHAAHLARVLRAKPGQEFDISVGESVRRGRVLSVSDDRVEFELGEQITVSATAKITAALAIFKFDRFEWAVEKLTELGVAEIVPLLASRTDPHLASAAAKRVERWRRVALAAAEQSRRVTPPEIAEPVKLRQYGPPGQKIVLAESEEELALKDALDPSSADVVIAIGPEGGWTADELRWFTQNGWKAVSLGRNILRAETAAIAATAIAMAELQAKENARPKPGVDD